LGDEGGGDPFDGGNLTVVSSKTECYNTNYRIPNQRTVYYKANKNQAVLLQKEEVRMWRLEV